METLRKKSKSANVLSSSIAKNLKSFCITENNIEGVLQKFVSPKGEQKSTLSIIWSNKLCFFERRAINYDGEKYHSQILPIRGTTLPHRMQSIANSIRYHISNITFEKMHISRMVLHFRLDKTDKLWLLYCSSLRLANNEDSEVSSVSTFKGNEGGYDDTKMNAIPLQITSDSDPKTRIFKTNHNFSQKFQKYEYAKCLHCDTEQESNSFYKISYKLITKGHLASKSKDKKSKEKKEHESTEEDLPKIIKTLHPDYKVNTCRELLDDLDMANKETYICENCYLQVTEFMLNLENVFSDEQKQEDSPNKKKKSEIHTSLSSGSVSKSSNTDKPPLRNTKQSLFRIKTKKKLKVAKKPQKIDFNLGQNKISESQSYSSVSMTESPKEKENKMFGSLKARPRSSSQRPRTNLQSSENLHESNGEKEEPKLPPIRSRHNQSFTRDERKYFDRPGSATPNSQFRSSSQKKTQENPPQPKRRIIQK